MLVDQLLGMIERGSVQFNWHDFLSLSMRGSGSRRKSRCFPKHRHKVRWKLLVAHRADRSAGSQVVNLRRLKGPTRMLDHGGTPLIERHYGWWRWNPCDNVR
jgi:hypothetical protein